MLERLVGDACAPGLDDAQNVADYAGGAAHVVRGLGIDALGVQVVGDAPVKCAGCRLAADALNEPGQRCVDSACQVVFRP